MVTAYHLARQLLPNFSCKFSRHDFTLAQLFACLVLREFQNVSYRRCQQLLEDCPQWLADIGLSKAPDHNTLCRAFHRLIHQQQTDRMLDVLVALFRKAGLLGLRRKPLTIDATIFERHHRSAHYDRRCRQMRTRSRGRTGNELKRPGKWGESVNRARAGQVQSMPKLAMAVAADCHLILAVKVRTGNGSDAPDFEDLLKQAHDRARFGAVVADAGYDSEANHRMAREELGVRSIIPPDIGRPTKKLPSGRWRRHMARRFAKKADKKLYGQRSQSETVNSMMKRNQGPALRARTAEGRKKEMLLKALVHDIALLCDEVEG